MAIQSGKLILLPRGESRGPKMVIDFFFRSLAEDQKECAIGILLTGTGSDGTEGFSAIKSEGGITFAQIPTSAKYSEMPKNAIEAGSVDIVMTPAEIAAECVKIADQSI